MERRWRIELLGRLRATRGEQEITHFRSQKTALLFAYLAYYPARPHSRGALMDLLWPDSRLEAARANLSNSLSWLRRQLHPETESSTSPPLILADHASVQLNPALFTTDVAELEAALEAAAHAVETPRPARWLVQAVELYQGELLPGYFEGWVLQERHWLAERYFQALGQLLRQLEAAGDWEKALQYAQYGVRTDPLREEAHRELIRIYAAAGQPAAALRQYQELQRLLKEQLGTTPDAATIALLTDLPQQAVRPPAPAVDEGRRASTWTQGLQSTAEKPRRLALLYRRHAQPDEQLLTMIESHLTHRGHRVFVDRHLAIGVAWAQEIERELREADAIIPLLSAAAVTSEMLAYELQIAHEAALTQRGKPKLLPVRVRFTGPLPEPLAAFLAPLQYALWQGTQDNEYLLDELTNALREIGMTGTDRPAHTVQAAPDSWLLAPGPMVGETASRLSSLPTRSQEPGARSGGEASPHPLTRPAGGVVPLDSPFYVVRPSDEEFRAAIEHRDSVVLIKGARQLGKTSLLARGLQQARGAGARVVLTDFQMIDPADLASLDRLYLTLADGIAYQLELDVLPEQVWRSHLGASTNFERYLQREVLGRVPASRRDVGGSEAAEKGAAQPLVWGLDEVDRLFAYDYSSQVFGLFRSWHNRRGLDPAGPWSQLTLAIAYATEAHLFITDINQSPFNIGTSLVLPEFTVAQVAELNQRYGAPLQDEAQVAQYHGLVKGHPYLVSRGLQEMVTHGLRMDTFEAEADRDEGIFGDHLRRILMLLVKDPALCDVVRALLRGEPCSTHESFYRLRSAGVLAGESMREARLRCPIYATYLERHLL
jgi:DNA-binding SARP family transcriptional activator